MNTTLTEQQQKAAQLLALGIRPVEVCRDCKVSARSLRRWRHETPDFQTYLDAWRRKGEAKSEAKQDDLAEGMAGLAKAEQKVYAKALEKLDVALETDDTKLVLQAIKEARECFKGSGKDAGVGDIQALLASVIAGAYGDEKLPMPQKRTAHVAITQPQQPELTN